MEPYQTLVPLATDNLIRHPYPNPHDGATSIANYHTFDKTAYYLDDNYPTLRLNKELANDYKYDDAGNKYPPCVH